MVVVVRREESPGGDAVKGGGRLRWRLAEDEGPGQDGLFDRDELLGHHVGTGEFAGHGVPPCQRPDDHQRGAGGLAACPSATPSTSTGDAATPAPTASPGRPTSTSGSTPARTSSARIVVKVNAVERLRAELSARRWAGHHMAMGTNTDPYQRCEGKFHLTQGVVGVLAEAAQPVLHPHQVDPHPARPRPARRGAARRTVGPRPTSRSGPSTRRSGSSPNRARPTRGSGWRRCAGSTGPASPAGCSSAR